MVTNRREPHHNGQSRLHRHYGLPPEEVIGQTPQLLKSGRHDEQFYATFWQSLHEIGSWSGELWQRRKNGQTYPVWETIEAVRDPDGRIIQYVAFFSDISQRKTGGARDFLTRQLRPLTGLPNRSLLHERIDQAIRQARRHGWRVALMFWISTASSRSTIPWTLPGRCAVVPDR